MQERMVQKHPPNTRGKEINVQNLNDLLDWGQILLRLNCLGLDDGCA